METASSSHASSGADERNESTILLDWFASIDFKRIVIFFALAWVVSCVGDVCLTAAMQKRQEEKRMKRLRDFMSSCPENKRCMDCMERGPMYVCGTYGTLVCTTCAGVQ